MKASAQINGSSNPSAGTDPAQHDPHVQYANPRSWHGRHPHTHQQPVLLAGSGDPEAMKRLFFLIALLFPILSWAQSIPQMDRRVILSGPTGLNWALSKKANANNGSLTNPTISGGNVTAPSISGGSASGQAISAPTVTGGSVSGTDESAGVALASGGTTSRTHALHYSDVTNVMDFGAKASVDFDNSPAFQLAINASCTKAASGSDGKQWPSGASSGVAAVFIPSGKYGVIESLTTPCPLQLYGAGRNSTTLAWAQTGTANLINLAAPLTDSNRFWYFGSVHDLDLINEGSQTGAAIRVSQCNECDIYNIATYGMYRSVVVFAGSDNAIHHFTFRQAHVQAVNGADSDTEAHSTAIEYYGSDNNGSAGCTASDLGNCATRGDILNIHDGHVDSSLDGVHEASDCIYVHDFGATVWARNLTCNQTRKGFVVRCKNSLELGACPQFLYLERFENESNNTAGTGININLDLDNFSNFICVDCELYQSQRGQHLAVFNGTRFHSGHVEWYGGKVQTTNGACIVSYIDGFQMHGGLVTDCGGDGNSADQWGIQLLSGAAGVPVSTNNLVDGVQFCHDNVGNMSNSMRPVDIGPSTMYSMVVNSGLQGCAGTSTNQNASSGANNSITNELGP